MFELFSEDFFQKNWAKQEAELSISNIPFHEGDVLDALRQYAQNPSKLLALNSKSEAVTVINGVRSPHPLQNFLVSDTDGTIEEYTARVDQYAKGQEWAVMYYGLYAATPALWDVAKQFADQLAHSLGFRPSGRVDIDCFIGRYSSTHVGIHVDHAHNFGFTLQDGKTMFAWPSTRKDLQELKYPEYEEYKSTAIALQNRTDRVAYFPHDAFHVAETGKNIAANVNIAFWETASDAQHHKNYITHLLHLDNRTRHDIRTSGRASLNPDNAFQHSALSTAIANSTLKRHMLVSQLICDTSSRLCVGRPPINVSEIESEITLRLPSTLQWVPLLETKELLISANGHCASFEYRDHLENFLSQLSSEEKVDISKLNDKLRNAAQKEILKTVKALASWGAL
ncbi:hypothetical protein MCO_00915 [Bartonella sp. DB5-6]|uniref:hypothetical protein n=1 Tax=Bartonella sp. DB5-6 TaxID=1094755 RepID=UPI00026E9CDE|nr:hypothetical protein [Bartonella sp. DB5-6]EJF77777.1 hypothetical protein MCO_00915 [Bartonella sp. DB5-6]